MTKATLCLWYNNDAEDAANFYAATFPDRKVSAIHRAPSDYPGGEKGKSLTVEFTVCGVRCIGLNGGPVFPHTHAFSFQIATDSQDETDRYWNAIVASGGRLGLNQRLQLVSQAAISEGTARNMSKVA